MKELSSTVCTLHFIPIDICLVPHAEQLFSQLRFWSSLINGTSIIKSWNQRQHVNLYHHRRISTLLLELYNHYSLNTDWTQHYRARSVIPNSFVRWKTNNLLILYALSLHRMWVRVRTSLMWLFSVILQIALFHPMPNFTLLRVTAYNTHFRVKRTISSYCSFHNPEVVSLARGRGHQWVHIHSTSTRG